MAKNNWFQFKQFRIIQERAAMKVGTDGVLLGAWADVSTARTILDIGAGTGLIALMMAQRSEAKVTGIEIEKNAAEEAIENAKNSPWNQQITILNISFQDFVKSKPGLFDRIVSNPPFFTNSQKSKCGNLAMAKHNHLLPWADLAHGITRLLVPDGKLAIILPVTAVSEFVKMAEKEKLFLLRETEVRPNNLKYPHRYLMEFGYNKAETEKNFLNIHNDNGVGFTDQYKELTRDFYLNF